MKRVLKRCTVLQWNSLLKRQKVNQQSKLLHTFVISQRRNIMKRILGAILVLAIAFSACNSNKAAYKTANGKKKLKHYNKLQYGERKTFNQ
jgi:hypothetical protein